MIKYYSLHLIFNITSFKLKENKDKLFQISNQYNIEQKDKKKISIEQCIDKKVYILVSVKTYRGFKGLKTKTIEDFTRKLYELVGIKHSKSSNLIEIDNIKEISEVIYNNRISKLKKADINRNQSENNHTIINDSSQFNTIESDNKEIQLVLPHRKFPKLNSNPQRFSEDSKIDNKNIESIDEIIHSLNNLVGIKNVKEKINNLTAFIKANNERYIKHNIKNPSLYYNMVIQGAKGTGKDTIVSIIYKLFYRLGVIGEGRFITLDASELWAGGSLDRNIGNAQSGVIFINDAHLLQFNNRRGSKDLYNTLEQWFIKYKENFIFIFAGEQEGIKALVNNPTVKRYINFQIDINGYSDNEIIELAKVFAKREKYKIDTLAEEVICKRVENERQRNNFQNAYTAKQIVEEAIINKGMKKVFKIDDTPNILQKDDFLTEEFLYIENKQSETEEIENDPIKELDRMIGLNQVKRKIKEISAYAFAQSKRKELGLKGDPLCLHMEFTGNPGTGKTTVARIVGKILKKVGVLSTGKFVEVSREDLVGRYVGHTAVKTAEKLKEAAGGVLFVDEAYSLSSESRVDFGYEAVSTIVKLMEDMREDLVIIFAGYKNEMERFIKMNPGLRDRIQFKIDFSDYETNELFQIFQKFCVDGEYEIDEESMQEFKSIISMLYENRDESFSNGRLIRKCFERIKMFQAARLMNGNTDNKEELTKIKLPDVQQLYEEEDIVEKLYGNKLKNCIGFNIDSFLLK